MLFGFIVVLEYFKTRQLNYRKNLSEANEQLKASNSTKERMLSILSHDFNAPVSSLVTTLDLFDEGILTDEEFRHVSARLRGQLQALTLSLADVLHWSKMQMTGDTGQTVNVNINDILNELLPLFGPAMLDKNITLHNNTGENISVYAYVDHVKLILRNLLSNAVKFSHKGGNIYINAVAFDDKTAVSITDEGTGIKPQILAALKNEQLKFTSSPGTAKEKGTGLGLMLVQEFLHKNNGTLIVESEPGKGSTFSVVLPAKG